MRIHGETRVPQSEALRWPGRLTTGGRRAVGLLVIAVALAGCTANSDAQVRGTPIAPSTELILSGQPPSSECTPVAQGQTITSSIDLFTAVGNRPVRLLAVEPVSTANLAVSHMDVIPVAGGLGSPTGIGLGVTDTYPPTSAQVAAMPAETWASRLPIGSDLPAKNRQYSLAVSIELSKYPGDGVLDGFDIRYRAGSITRVLRTTTRIHLTSGQCGHDPGQLN